MLPTNLKALKKLVCVNGEKLNELDVLTFETLIKNGETCLDWALLRKPLVLRKILSSLPEEEKLALLRQKDSKNGGKTFLHKSIINCPVAINIVSSLVSDAFFLECMQATDDDGLAPLQTACKSYIDFCPIRAAESRPTSQHDALERLLSIPIVISNLPNLAQKDGEHKNALIMAMYSGLDEDYIKTRLLLNFLSVQSRSQLLFDERTNSFYGSVNNLILTKPNATSIVLEFLPRDEETRQRLLSSLPTTEWFPDKHCLKQLTSFIFNQDPTMQRAFDAILADYNKANPEARFSMLERMQNYIISSQYPRIGSRSWTSFFASPFFSIPAPDFIPGYNLTAEQKVLIARVILQMKANWMIPKSENDALSAPRLW